jgi:hypothetical protein
MLTFSWTTLGDGAAWDGINSVARQHKDAAAANALRHGDAAQSLFSFLRALWHGLPLISSGPSGKPFRFGTCAVDPKNPFGTQELRKEWRTGFSFLVSQAPNSKRTIPIEFPCAAD